MKILRALLFIVVLVPFISTSAQKIGKMAPEKDPVVFPKNSWGMDFVFSEGGFGLGTFYRRDLTNTLTFFTDLSISEAKDEREIEYIDYWGNSIVIGKKNRILMVPLTLGLQQRLFRGSLADNLRPYISAGIGPTAVVTTPYDKEFFSSFSKAQAKYAAGGYVGFGAYFGSEKNSLLGLSVRYYYTRFFDEGVESLYGRFNKSLGGFYIGLSLGTMF